MAKLTWNDCSVQSQSALYGWGDGAALYIHEGEYVDLDYPRTGYVIPGRRWTEFGLEECVPIESFVDNFYGSIADAFQAMARELDQAFQDAITEPNYGWDRLTLRSTGELAGSPRNIVDTGTLRDSQYLVLTEGA